MPTLHYVKKARKPNPVVSQEDIDRANNPKTEADKYAASYYWWQFAYRSKSYSKTRPKNSQLTQSEFLQRIYAVEETISELSGLMSYDEITSQVEQITSELEELRDEQEEKKDAMPEGLQEGPTGELLQERYDCVDEMLDEFSSIDERDEDDDRAEVEEDARSEAEDERDEDDPDHDDEWLADRIEELIQEKLDEKRDEWVEELQAIAYNGS